MFKIYIFCALALSLCGATVASDEEYKEKFEEQTDHFSEFGISREEFKNEWEKCKSQLKDQKTEMKKIQIHIDDVPQEFSVFETKHTVLEREENGDEDDEIEKTLCFAIGEDKTVYYIHKIRGSLYQKYLVTNKYLETQKKLWEEKEAAKEAAKVAKVAKKLKEAEKSKKAKEAARPTWWPW